MSKVPRYEEVEIAGNPKRENILYIEYKVARQIEQLVASRQLYKLIPSQYNDLIMHHKKDIIRYSKQSYAEWRPFSKESIDDLIMVSVKDAILQEIIIFSCLEKPIKN